MNHFRRKVLVGAATSVLPITLFSVGLTLSLFATFSTPATLKDALKESGIYGVFVSGTLAQAQEKTTQAAGDLPIHRPEVQAIIKDAFPPNYLESQTGNIIDGAYAWMRGETPVLAFNLEIGQARAKLITGATAYVDQRLAGLPVCTAVDLSLPAAPPDPWTVQCVPPNFDRAAAVRQVRDQITKSDTFLQDTHVTASNITDAEGKTLQERLQFIPETYAQIKNFFIAMALISLACAAVIVFVHPVRRQGIKRLAWIMLFTGITTSGMAVLAGVAVGRVADSVAASQQEGATIIAAHAAKVIELLAGNVRTWWLGFGLSLVVVGVGTLITLLVLRKRAEHHRDVHAPASFSAKLDHAEESAANTPNSEKTKTPKISSGR